ncbi:hypothetical protein SDC9_153979 [bioreactor metagenome]|uniref:Uncharacterized protein n=1 Tax=bioreactor metagenome TaxID=1076179 RepID=A0A645F239_9ZZZZ
MFDDILLVISGFAKHFQVRIDLLDQLLESQGNAHLRVCNLSKYIITAHIHLSLTKQLRSTSLDSLESGLVLMALVGDNGNLFRCSSIGTVLLHIGIGLQKELDVRVEQCIIGN